MNIKSTILELQSLLYEGTDESLIVRVGAQKLEHLRNHWRANKESFSEEDNSSLKQIGKRIDALKRFTEELEEFPYLATKEEIDDVLGNLYHIVDEVNELKVAGRVQKEIRELVERKPGLPSRAASDKDRAKKKAMATLQSAAPTCNKCDNIMILREGNGDYFWGCSTFPTCWGKKFLVKDERSALPD